MDFAERDSLLNAQNLPRPACLAPGRGLSSGAARRVCLPRPLAYRAVRN